jgi:hypothetical protein
MNAEKDNKQFVRYLNGEMARKEELDFKHELENNQEFSEAYIGFLAMVNMKNEMDQLVKDQVRSGNLNWGKRKFTPIKIAAILLLLIATSSVLIFNHLLGTNSLVTENNMKYFADGGTRGDNIIVESEETKAFDLYRTKDFANAAILFEGISDTVSLEAKPRIELYAGICLLWSKDKKEVKRAEEYLLSCLQSNGEYKDVARWFYAIALYENKKKDKAKKIFEQIANGESGYKKKEALRVLAEDY